MKNIKIICSIIFFFLTCCLACNNNLHEDKKNAKMTNSLVYKKSMVKSDSIIFGFWRYVDDEFVTLIIQKDSVFYPDNFRSFSYILQNESIIINYDDNYSDTSKYQMKGRDTLLLMSDNGWGTYIRNESR